MVKFDTALAVKVREQLGDKFDLESPIANAIEALRYTPAGTGVHVGAVYTRYQGSLCVVFHTWLKTKIDYIVDITPLNIQRSTPIASDIGGTVGQLQEGQRVYVTDQVYYIGDSYLDSLVVAEAEVNDLYE